MTNNFEMPKINTVENELRAEIERLTSELATCHSATETAILLTERLTKERDDLRLELHTLKYDSKFGSGDNFKPLLDYGSWPKKYHNLFGHYMSELTRRDAYHKADIAHMLVEAAMGIKEENNTDE